MKEISMLIVLIVIMFRSSLYAEYASCVGPLKQQRPLALKYVFILVSFLKLASGCKNMNDHLF